MNGMTEKIEKSSKQKRYDTPIMPKKNENSDIMNGEPRVLPENVGEMSESGISEKGMLEAVSNVIALPKPALIVRARKLGSPESARKQLAKLIEARSKGEIAPEMFSQLAWSFQILLPSLRAERWNALEKRIAELEKQRAREALI